MWWNERELCNLYYSGFSYIQNDIVVHANATGWRGVLYTRYLARALGQAKYARDDRVSFVYKIPYRRVSQVAFMMNWP